MLITYREALNQAMREEMRRDDRIFLIGEEVGYYQGAFKVSKGFVEEFGDQRVLDTPITEAGFTGLAIGAAMAGLHPIVELMTFNFGILALDQIVNNAAKIRYMSGGQLSVPIVIRGPGSAAHQLGAQHSQSLEAWFCHVPGLKVIAPATPHDAKGLLKSAIRDHNPVIFIEAQLLYSNKGEVSDGDFTIPIGRAEVKRGGRDVTLVAYSKMLLVALDAAKELAGEGIEVEVVDPRTLKPLDLETIVTSVKKTGRLVVVEEGWRFAGLGAQIAESVYARAFDYLDAPIVRVTGEEVPMPYTRPLEDAAIPDRARVMAAVKRVLNQTVAPGIDNSD
jgi:pyruvate/2-oxoglutarate/acetoin dehydrogenase E1 component